MRTGEFCGREKFQSAVVIQTQKKQDVTTSLKKIPSHVANTEKNYGLIKVIRVNKKPELIDQCRPLCVYLRLNRCGTLWDRNCPVQN